jgi:hypothetical protein
MDIPSKVATSLLGTLASCNTPLLKLHESVRKSNGVRSVQQRLEVLEAQRHPSIEGYVDAELENRFAVCWWVEANWSANGWDVDASIRINDRQGQFVAKEFPRRTGKRLDDFLANLKGAVAELLDSLNGVDRARGCLKEAGPEVGP